MRERIVDQRGVVAVLVLGALAHESAQARLSRALRHADSASAAREWRERPASVLVLGLHLKYLVMIAIQGTQRMRRRRFRWPEDAAQWRGEAGPESELVERAQAVLRNDAESQPLFLAASAVWIVLGADARAALCVCTAYVAARWLHAIWLLVPRQPHRTRVFGVSQLCLLVVSVDLCRLALAR